MKGATTLEIDLTVWRDQGEIIVHCMCDRAENYYPLEAYDDEGRTVELTPGEMDKAQEKAISEHFGYVQSLREP